MLLSTPDGQTTVDEATHWLTAKYRVRADARTIDARAQAIALEQSVEAPLAAIRDARVAREVVARVADVAQVGDSLYDVAIRLAVETTGFEAGQLVNMLFGNTSLHDDVALIDAEFAHGFAARFGGPRFGIEGIRRVTGVADRPLTCSALKPQGLSAAQLASLARTFARGGIDVVKDDHGLADQASAPFATRVRDVQRAIDDVNRASGSRCVYAPSLHGHYGQIREQIGIARDHGVQMILVTPMVAGVSTLAALAREAGIPIVAHPALAGSLRIAPPLLLGKLFRLFGADAAIFPNAGGRFGYGADVCAAIASTARQPWNGVAPMLPVPAGGMTVERVAEMCTTFGNDTMFLISGDLLTAGDALEDRCGRFARAVETCRGLR